MKIKTTIPEIIYSFSISAILAVGVFAIRSATYKPLPTAEPVDFLNGTPIVYEESEENEKEREIFIFDLQEYLSSSKTREFALEMEYGENWREIIENKKQEEVTSIQEHVNSKPESSEVYKISNTNYISNSNSEPIKIRCTGYCDYGYTKSGEYVREGIVAGKKEWLGKSCKIYSVNSDGTCGEVIGDYEFLDTGYGINGSLLNGTSIDVWFPSEDAVWEWMHTYGDYVYLEFV